MTDTTTKTDPVADEISEASLELQNEIKTLVSTTLSTVYNSLNDTKFNLETIWDCRSCIDRAGLRISDEMAQIDLALGKEVLGGARTLLVLLRDVVDLIEILSTNGEALNIRNLSHIQRIDLDISRDAILESNFSEEVALFIGWQNSYGISIISRLTGIDPNDPRMHRFQLTYPEREDSSDEA